MKTYYKQFNQKTNILSSAKSLVEMFKTDNYIDEDCYFAVKYKDGSMLSYPDQTDQIKFKNIVNIYFAGTDDNGDFTFDFIGTQESYDFIISMEYEKLNKYSNLKENDLFIPNNPLIIEDMDQYFKLHF